MKRLLCIHTGTAFFGSQYFRWPAVFTEVGIKAVTASVTDFSPDSIIAVAEEHPEETVDGVLLHGIKQLDAFLETGLYTEVPLFIAAHVLRKNSDDIRRWVDSVESGRDIFVFAGAVRTARAYHLPGQDNLRVVIAPIMGRSFRAYSPMPSDLIEGPKKYDIGFFSMLTPKKQPHRVLETASNVAEQLGRELRVLIAGDEIEMPYTDLLKELMESSHYENLNVEYKPDCPNNELFEAVQKSRLIYLPLVKPTETTCYAAWEAVSYDVPVVGSDWAGVGEAIRSSRHPHSEFVPVHEVNSKEEIFPESVHEEYPDLVEEIIEEQHFSRLMIDELKAQQAITHALETDTQHTRKLEIPEQIHVESTVAAFADALNGVLTPSDGVPDEYIEASNRDVQKTTRGYSILLDPTIHNPEVYQTTTYL